MLREVNIGMLLLLCFTVLPLFGQDIKKDLGEFQEVKTFRGVQVVFIPAQENRIEISGHSKEKVKYSIENSRLEIKLTLDNLWSDDNTLITVYGRSVNILDANEGSLIEVRGVLEGENYEFRAQEGASIRTEVKANEVNSKAISGGVIHMDGKAKSQKVEVNTGGQFFGKRLKSDRVEIKASTAGKAEVYADSYCKATASLGGVIEIEGNPSKVDFKTSLGGKIL